MRQFMMTVTSLAVFGAMVATVQAENQTARPSQTASAAQSTCTGLKLACLIADVVLRLARDRDFATLRGNTA
jgi:hypothetical protein